MSALKLHVEEPERITQAEAYERFARLIEPKPEIKLAEGTWAERVERQPEARAR